MGTAGYNHIQQSAPVWDDNLPIWSKRAGVKSFFRLSATLVNFRHRRMGFLACRNNGQMVGVSHLQVGLPQTVCMQYLLIPWDY